MSDKDLEEAVDEDIAEFDKYFQSLGNGPLNGYEKAAIKTYLHFKTHAEFSPTPPPPTNQGDQGG